MGLFDDDDDNGQTFSFEKVGDSVTGVILSSRKRQATNMDTGEPMSWQDGNPVMLRVFTLQTDQVSATDDGLRRVTLSYGAQKTLKATPNALKADIGWVMTMTFEREESPTRRGRNPQKIYRFEFRPPATDADATDALSGILA